MVLHDRHPTTDPAPAAVCPVAHSPTTYGSLLRIEDLLGLQDDLGGERDALFFVTVHQVYELWFAVILAELERARDGLFTDDPPRVLYALGRVAAVERVLVEQLDTLKTISPGSFRSLRGTLSNASGFQSVQFREIEFVSGLRDRDYPRRAGLSASEVRRLRQRLAEPTLWDGFEALLDARGADLEDLTDALREPECDDDLVRVADALLDHDEGFTLWRSKHVQMVERLIGAKPGTGGSSGAGYLRSRLDERFFPPLWELRSRV